MGQYDEELVDSMRTGQWGFSYQTSGSTSLVYVPDLLSFSVPPYLTRHWTITLGAFRYSSNGPSGGLLFQGANAPADNQVCSTQQTKVVLQWGSFGMMERAVVDYPCRGATFQLHASVMRLSIQWPGSIASNQAPPLLSGFVSPFARSNLPWGAPTFTTPPNPLVAAAGSRVYPVPDRALAYRLEPVGAPTASTLQVLQLNGDGGAIQVDGTVVAPQDPMSGKNSDYVPLNQGTQFIRVNNTDVTPLGVALVFLLDLG